jgi:hypothetical protein
MDGPAPFTRSAAGNRAGSDTQSGVGQVRPILTPYNLSSSVLNSSFSRNSSGSVNARRLFEKSGIDFSLASFGNHSHLPLLEEKVISRQLSKQTLSTPSTPKSQKFPPRKASIDPLIQQSTWLLRLTTYLCHFPHFTKLTATDHHPPLRLRQHARPLRIPRLRSLRRARK